MSHRHLQAVLLAAIRAVWTENGRVAVHKIGGEQDYRTAPARQQVRSTSLPYPALLDSCNLNSRDPTARSRVSSR